MTITIPVPTLTALQLVWLAVIATGAAVGWLILGYVYDKGWREPLLVHDESGGTTLRTCEKAPLTGLSRFCVFVASVKLFLSVPMATVACVLAVFNGWQ